MNAIKVIGIDLAKSVFQICVWMSDGTVTSNRKVSRSKLLDTVRQFPVDTPIAMEACATSHYWGRTFHSMGYPVRLIPTQHVKALTRHQKNDANDALAICETAFRPGIHFVPVKTIEQQDIKALRNTRQLMVEQRTAIVNQTRALIAEQGVTIPVGINVLQQQLPDIIEDADNIISLTLRRFLFSLLENMHLLNEHINTLEHEIAALCQQQPKYKTLLTIPGVGPLIAAAFLSEVNAEQFTNGRQLSAWCGLVPRQHSSDGKNMLTSMTKNGNRGLRTLIIHGARAVMRCVQKRDDALGKWLRKVIERRGKMKATIALANKLTRIAWRLLAESTNFNMSMAFSIN
ncbi:IS110 family transposase [Acerihabitans sp. TG2]|uniref:IS110 family transposase n=1 Tax=Acerihabitans sp. TG2 TaxID=3096008 RepID=UPI002B22E581|nr:IS110 family transposase [Acerihabitans sp. TG2]MEA9392785.1 IS110 family transposase [Acerihabitans sp. TG2]